MSIPITTLLVATSCPPVQINTQNPSIAATYNDVATGLPGAPTMSTGESPELAAILNSSFGYEWMVSNRGGGMPGIITGLQFGFVGGLLMQVSPGQANIGGIVEIPSPAAVAINPSLAGQPVNLTVPDNSTNFLWLNANGSFQFVSGTTPPNSTSVCLGNVTAASGVITAFDNSAVQNLVGGLCYRATADLWVPGDTPNAAARIVTQATNAQFLWDGVSHKQLVDNTKQAPISVAQVSVGSLYQLTNAHPNSLWITVTAGTPIIQLPNPANCPPGWNITLCNVGASLSFVLKDYLGTTTYCTVTHGEQIPVGIMPGTGAFVFPTGPYTPGPVMPVIGS